MTHPARPSRPASKAFRNTLVIVKEMSRKLLRREHRAGTPQLRSLAARVGIIGENAS